MLLDERACGKNKKIEPKILSTVSQHFSQCLYHPTKIMTAPFIFFI